MMQTLCQNRPIGGHYDLDLRQRPVGEAFETVFDYADFHHRFTASGRRAFHYILTQSALPAHAKLLMPEYGCWSALGPVIDEFGYDCLLYKTAPNFDIEIENDALKQADALVLVNYFGTTNLRDFALHARRINPDLLIILDHVPSLYELRRTHELAEFSDWQFYSFRKWFAAPDGGMAVCTNLDWLKADPSVIPEPYKDYPYLPLWRRAAQLKHDHPESAEFLPLFQQAEAMIAPHYDAISQDSYDVLNGFNLSHYARQRRINYDYLHTNWPKQDHVLPCLPSTLGDPMVPQYFVIDVDEDLFPRLQHFFFDDQIYPPTHWPDWDNIGSPYSHRRLSLPIDQRYNLDDMLRLIDRVNEFGSVTELF